MLKVRNLEKSYNHKTLFEEVSFIVNSRDKVGLIGPNGVGKSTLLKIIAGKAEADDGEIESSESKIFYLDQELEYENGDTVGSFLRKSIKQDWEEYLIDMALAKVGLEEIDRDQLVKNLSGGQKTRLGFARLVMEDPSLILIDEPTNNLDLEGIRWLERFVKQSPTPMLIISHDRQFLDNCVNRIFQLDVYLKRMFFFTGNYSDYIEQRDREFEIQKAAYRLHEEKRQKMEDWITRKKEQLAFHQNPKVARQLKNMKKRYEREIEKVDVTNPKAYEAFKIRRKDFDVYQRRTLYHVKNLVYQDLFKFKDLVILAGDRIWLKGANGAGKTSFIKLLMNGDEKIRQVVDFKLGYFSQEHETLDFGKTVYDSFAEAVGVFSERQIRSALGGYLFTDQALEKKVSQLSQGERVRLMIAILVNKENEFLILDEPTNHLDIESREVLEQALAEYGGGFILVSHDRYFLNRVGVNRVIAIEKSLS